MIGVFKLLHVEEMFAKKKRKEQCYGVWTYLTTLCSYSKVNDKSNSNPVLKKLDANVARRRLFSSEKDNEILDII